VLDALFVLITVISYIGVLGFVVLRLGLFPVLDYIVYALEALFLSSSTRKNCKRQTAIKTGKPLPQTFVTQ